MQYKVKDVTKVIEQFAPLSIQEKWDNSGLCIGSPDAVVSSVLSVWIALRILSMRQ